MAPMWESDAPSNFPNAEWDPGRWIDDEQHGDESSIDGDLIKQVKLGGLPKDVSFAHTSLSKFGQSEDNAISCIVNQNQLLIWNFHEDTQPVSYTFDDSHGNAVAHAWQDTENIIVGFSEGSLALISMAGPGTGKELLRIREYGEGLLALAVSTKLQLLATASDECIKVHESSNVNEVIAIIEVNDADPEKDSHSSTRAFPRNLFSCSLEWSDDGQLMGIVSPRNVLHVFISRLPLMSSVSSAGIVARFTSLLEITLESLCGDMKTNQLTSRAVPVRIEPTFMGIGPNHLAVGLDNSAYFYNISSTEGVRVVSERTYPETVRTIKLNGSYAAAGTVTGRVIFHMIEFDSFNAKVLTLVENEGGHCQVYNQGKLEAQDLPDLVHSYTLREKTFPQSDGRVIDFDLSDSLLSYSTDSRKLYQFHIGEWAIVNTYEHYCPITSLASTKSGCVLAFIDTQHNAYIFNSVSSTLVEVPNSPVGMSRILWNFDDCENPLLMAVSNDFLIIYRYFVASILLSEDECAKQGREVSLFGATLDFSRSFEGTTGNMNLLASEKKTPQIASPQRHILSSRRAAYGQCRLLDRMRLPPNHTPLGFFAEDVCFLTQSGSLAHATLPSHTFRNYTKPYAKNRGAGPDVGLENTSDARGTKQTSYIKLEKIQDEKSKHLDNSLISHFEKALNAGAFEDALILADLIQLPLRWHQLARACIICLEFDLAIQAFRRLNDCGSVLVIQRLMNIEEKQLLYGHVCMFLGEFNHAQEFFLASSKPEAALEMRRDLLHWDAALQLARSLQPHEVPFISREYAFELECVGDYVNALMHYERALERPATSDKHTDHSVFETEATTILNGGCDGFGDCEFDEWDEHVDTCSAGVIRNTIRLGDHKRGLSMVLKSPSLALKKECASILEQARQWSEAAALHEAVGQMDAAIAVYLKSKNYKKAGELLCTTKASCQLYLEYAKARESSGAYAEAISAYESAKDWESVVRLTLDKMNNPTAAVKVVREKKSVGAAKTVAQYFTKVGDFASAIQVLVLSKCHDAAYELALKHRKMDVYANVIGRGGSPDKYKSIAVHFECERNSLLAGKFFLYAKQYVKAVRHLLQVPYSDTSSALDLAIEAVGEARDKKLTNLVITYLMGESDGIAKDLRHLFRLYMALHQYRDAARTAVIIAREEQSNGKYRNARDLLFSMVQELRQRHIKVPVEMLDNLGLLHSYILAKCHVKFGNHMMAARLLIRIAQNISKFPSHIVPILSSTVIECQKVNLKHTGFTYASMLLRTEYREKIDSRYRRRFESIVRHPEKLSSEEAEALSAATPCPFCSDAVAEYELTCGSCRTHLPYCTLTGKHVVKEDVTLCPNCDFPMTYTTLMSHIENQPDLACQMCSAPLVRDEIRRLADAVGVLLRWNLGLGEPEAGAQTPTTARDASIQQSNTLGETFR
ncbi:WD repeat-containing protein [Echinococcus granulosus]|uniref:WD repeat-containing protein n=1 Tax=Echinococcus granulosus TaxID=6210 RepID=W6VBK4_ECHGR|nr:WD repeat-containing protein [Echinococcus granulosus]EUB64214.1 WD repeat-containing protein [Echinococcus granulosus]